jgi:hypothetical protein
VLCMEVCLVYVWFVVVLCREVFRQSLERVSSSPSSQGSWKAIEVRKSLGPVRGSIQLSSPRNIQGIPCP